MIISVKPVLKRKPTNRWIDYFNSNWPCIV